MLYVLSSDSLASLTHTSPLSLHDALPICFQAAERARMDYAVAVPGIITAIGMRNFRIAAPARVFRKFLIPIAVIMPGTARSEEHTSELQSLRHLVCRLLLEKKTNTRNSIT